jgi:hypothetical protein
MALAIKGNGTTHNTDVDGNAGLRWVLMRDHLLDGVTRTVQTDPHTIKARILGSIMFGVTAALYGKSLWNRVASSGPVLSRTRRRAWTKRLLSRSASSRAGSHRPNM